MSARSSRSVHAGPSPRSRMRTAAPDRPEGGHRTCIAPRSPHSARCSRLRSPPTRRSPAQEQGRPDESPVRVHHQQPVRRTLHLLHPGHRRRPGPPRHAGARVRVRPDGRRRHPQHEVPQRRPRSAERRAGPPPLLGEWARCGARRAGRAPEAEAHLAGAASVRSPGSSRVGVPGDTSHSCQEARVTATWSRRRPSSESGQADSTASGTTT
jgi:hypothetical protein